MSQCYPGKKLYPHLLSPIRIGNVKFKNRIIGAPTSPSMATAEGFFTPEMIAYLEDRASGGAAMVTYGEAIPHGATGKSHNKQVVLDSFGVRQGLSESVRLIHNHGCLASIQLSHGGMYGGLASVGGDKGVCEIAYGPSEMDMPAGHVYEMPIEVIDEIVESYRKGAQLCKEVGYDCVQVHIAHGWLHNQFLSPLFNHRTDEYGGSLENRARLVVRTLDAVRAGVGKGFPIELRMNGDDMVEGGVTLDEYIELAKMVEDKVDFFNISVGNHEDPAMFCRTHPSAFFPRGINVQFAAAIKKHVKKPVACVGSLIHPAQMEEIIASGQADLIEIGRGMFADPAIADKALCGRADDITPCIRCYECFGNTMTTEMARCTVNPHQGQQIYGHQDEKKAEVIKNILVAGGGPAGMQAAITAAKRGHKVTLVEKADKLGGNLYPAGAPYFKEDIIELCEVLIRRVYEGGVNVILNTEVTPEFVAKFNPDALIVAIGAEEFKLPVKGIDGPNVMMAIDAELHPEKLGKKVAIMGGGLVGTEAAVSFSKEGHEVSVIEMRPDVAIDTNPFYRGGLMDQVNKCGAKLYVNTMVKEVVDNGVLVECDGKQFVVEADTVVCAAGFRANYAKVDAIADLVDENYIIGDCKKVAQIGQAMDDGYHIGILV